MIHPREPVLEERLLRLLIAARDDGDASASAELNALLRASPEARRVLARLLVDEHAMVDCLRSHGIASLLGTTAPPAESSSARRTLRLWSMAAGLIFGALCASLAFLSLNPVVRPASSVRLNVINGDFEQAGPIPANGLPTDFGIWSGDHATIVEAERGVVPHGGRRMLRFLRSDSLLAGSRVGPPNSNLFQVVDLRPYRIFVSSGQARLSWSAWFNAVLIPETDGMGFTAGLWTFSGEPAMLPDNWSRHLYLETAKSSCAVHLDSSSLGWRKVEGAMIVPPGADFVVIEIKAMPAPGQPEDRPFVFPGAYADDVELTLTVVPESQR